MSTVIQNLEAIRPRSARSEVAPPPTKMRLVVVTAEGEVAQEHAVLAALFTAGLERCHVRKPGWSATRLEAWLRPLPAIWRPRLMLHSHHELVETLGLGGRHWRDEDAGPLQPKVGPVSDWPHADTVGKLGRSETGPTSFGRSITSRSCHDLSTLRTSLGCFDAVFFSPVFSSISKKGYGTRAEFCEEDLAGLLAARTAAERRTEVIALGGITAERVARCAEFGFDGVAVLGAVWQAADPVAAFGAIQRAVGKDGPPGRPLHSAGPAVPTYLATTMFSP